MPAYGRLTHSPVPSEKLKRSLFSTPSKNQQKNKRNCKHVSCSKAKEQWFSLTFILPVKWKLCKSLHLKSNLWPLQGRTLLSSSRRIRLCSENTEVGLSFVRGDAQAIPQSHSLKTILAYRTDCIPSACALDMKTEFAWNVGMCFPRSIRCPRSLQANWKESPELKRTFWTNQLGSWSWANTTLI